MVAKIPDNGLNITDLAAADDFSLTSDGAVINFGADGDTILTHTDGTGLTLNSTNKLCFNDASQFVQGSSATVLSIGATDEIDLTATAVDLNGTLNVSGVATFQSTPVFPDGSLALADLDIDGGTDIGAAIVDADLFIIDDGAGGTNRKTVASRLHTYIAANTPSFFVTLGSDQTGIVNNTLTKLAFDTEAWDSDGAFASNKFTVPSGEDGKYVFTYRAKTSGIDDGEKVVARLYKNGSGLAISESLIYSSASDQQISSMATYIIDLAADDYIELYILHTEGANQTAFGGTADGCFLSGYKLHGV